LFASKFLLKYAAEAATAAETIAVETPAVIAVTTAVILALNAQACSAESSVDLRVAVAAKLLVVQRVTLAATVAVDAKSNAVQFESIPLTKLVGGTFGSGRQVNRNLQPHSGQDPA
jgi:hypothetical protein